MAKEPPGSPAAGTTRWRLASDAQTAPTTPQPIQGDPPRLPPGSSWGRGAGAGYPPGASAGSTAGHRRRPGQRVRRPISRPGTTRHHGPERPPSRVPARPGPHRRRPTNPTSPSPVPARRRQPQPGYGPAPWSGSAPAPPPGPAPWSGAASSRPGASGRGGVEDRHRGAGDNRRRGGRRHRGAAPPGQFRLAAGQDVGIGLGGHAAPPNLITAIDEPLTGLPAPGGLPIYAACGHKRGKRRLQHRYPDDLDQHPRDHSIRDLPEGSGRKRTSSST